MPAGMETPELIELRKKKIEEAMDGWVPGGGQGAEVVGVLWGSGWGVGGGRGAGSGS